MSNNLETVEVYTNKDKSYNTVIIWLHGLGADGHDFVPIVNKLDSLKNKNIKFIFPHAPMRSITINNNIVMRGWFDIYSLDRTSYQDIEGITNSKNKILDLINIEHNKNNIDYSQIILAGFSQGGALALYTALTCEQKLNSVLALSCYLPISDNCNINRTKANQDTNIFLAHGTYDPIIPIKFSEETRDFLEKLNYNVVFKDYHMEHSLCDEEVSDINLFFKQNLL